MSLFAAAAYERVPVDSFGAGLLRGMGWTEGAAIGLSNQQVWVLILTCFGVLLLFSY